jgi:hypothetical protein
MRMSYLLLIPAVAALCALGIPKRFGYFQEAAVSFAVFLAIALAVWLFEQQACGKWPFKRRYTGR